MTCGRCDRPGIWRLGLREDPWPLDYACDEHLADMCRALAWPGIRVVLDRLKPGEPTPQPRPVDPGQPTARPRRVYPDDGFN